MWGGRVYRFNTGPLLNAEAATYATQSLPFSEQSDPEIPCPPFQIADAVKGSGQTKIFRLLLTGLH